MNKVPVLLLAKEHKAVFRPTFLSWLSLNFHVFEVFCQLADTLWERGRRRYSSRTIVEKMRFDHSVSEHDSPFKVANAISPDLGRLYVLLNPTRVTMFEYVRDDFEHYVREACNQLQ